jgi:hypothetical protein
MGTNEHPTTVTVWELTVNGAITSHKVKNLPKTVAHSIKIEINGHPGLLVGTSKGLTKGTEDTLYSVDLSHVDQKKQAKKQYRKVAAIGKGAVVAADSIVDEKVVVCDREDRRVKLLQIPATGVTMERNIKCLATCKGKYAEQIDDFKYIVGGTTTHHTSLAAAVAGNSSVFVFATGSNHLGAECILDIPYMHHFCFGNNRIMGAAGSCNGGIILFVRNEEGIHCLNGIFPTD